MNRLCLAITLLVCLLRGPGPRAEELSFGIEITGGETFPGIVMGREGAVVKVTGFVTLDIPAPDARGWTFALAVTSPDGLEFCIDVAASEPFPASSKDRLIQEQVMDLEPPCDPESSVLLERCETVIPLPNTAFVIQDAGVPLPTCNPGTPDDGDRVVGSPGAPENGGVRGIIDGTVLRNGAPVLPAVTDFRILPFAVDVTVPEGESRTLRLSFREEGMIGPGQIVRNNVFLGKSTRVTNNDTVELSVEPGGSVPGDCDSDGFYDLTDVICFLKVLWIGEPEFLPCGNGEFDDPVNILMFDWEPSGEIDFVDAISGVKFLFMGTDPHHLSNRESGIGCIENPGCPTPDFPCRE